ncbi:MAG: hypothetical protein NTZ46_04910 [Verrucomicrobia bacterium]|nr:hypothetical protein [Verrucomicrobiota bacterium]
MAPPLKPVLLSALLLALANLPAQAAFWRCELPGGVYMVSLPAVSSVSTHEYVVDGAVRVTELTIGTNSAVVARFYYLEPMVPKSPVGFGQSLLDKAQEKAQEASTRTETEEVWKKVVKNYPLTTHAHTVEYRLDSTDQIKKVQKSLEDAWRKNQETFLKISSGDSGSEQ